MFHESCKSMVKSLSDRMDQLEEHPLEYVKAEMDYFHSKLIEYERRERENRNTIITLTHELNQLRRNQNKIEEQVDYKIQMLSTDVQEHSSKEERKDVQKVEDPVSKEETVIDSNSSSNPFLGGVIVGSQKEDGITKEQVGTFTPC